MPAPDGGHQSSSSKPWYSAPTRSSPRAASGMAAITVKPVFSPSVNMGMPAAQPTIMPPTIADPEMGEHGDPLTAVSPPEPAGGAPGPYQ